jgi:uncharacterized protein (TIGR02145 family)
MLKWFEYGNCWLGAVRSGVGRRSSFFKPFLFLVSLSSLLISCTDYVSKIDDQIVELQSHLPSSSSVTSSIRSSSSIHPVSVVDPLDVVVGSFVDSRDYQTYKTVTIGTQTWMAANLNYNFIELESACYKDNSSNCAKYGRLYTWEAAKKACPSGWHLPTKAEFEILITAVGGAAMDNVLKSTSGWSSEGVLYNGTDSYSFSALPAGIKSDESYGGVENFTGFWSSTKNEYRSSEVYYMTLYGTPRNFDILYSINPDGYSCSVRCVKD